MKLHHFVSAPSEQNLKLQGVGKALVVKSIAEAAKPIEKPVVSIKKEPLVDMDGDGDVDGMDAAIADMVSHHKSASSKIKHYD